MSRMSDSGGSRPLKGDRVVRYTAPPSLPAISQVLYNIGIIVFSSDV